MLLFDWDENKNRINKQKHGIDFIEASTVFLINKQYFLMIRSIRRMRIGLFYLA